MDRSVTKRIKSRISSGKYSACERCKLTWNVVEPHTTFYTPYEGLFPLCEGCWIELGSPEARIEYYDQLLKRWEKLGSPVSPETRMLIGKAVANGG